MGTMGAIYTSRDHMICQLSSPMSIAFAIAFAFAFAIASLPAHDLLPLRHMLRRYIIIEI